MRLLRWIRPKQNDYWGNREWNMAVARVKGVVLFLVVIILVYVYLFAMWYLRW